MPTLLETQQAMRRALLEGGPPPAGIIAGACGEEARIAIYRNNLRGTLTGALRLSYPAVRRLVGEDFFAGLAARFIAAEPPRNPDLYAYGAALPAFIESFEAARDLPYLADVARLEWAVNQALHAPLTAPLDPARLATVPAEAQGAIRFHAHPSLSTVVVRYPAEAIWQAVLTEDEAARAAALGAVDLGAGGARLAVSRGAAGLRIQPLLAAQHDLLAALMAGEPLSDALERAPEAEAAAWLGRFLAEGFFTGYAV